MQKQIDELNASHERQLGAMRAAFEERLSQIEQVMASKDGKRALEQRSTCNASVGVVPANTATD